MRGLFAISRNKVFSQDPQLKEWYISATLLFVVGLYWYWRSTKDSFYVKERVDSDSKRNYFSSIPTEYGL